MGLLIMTNDYLQGYLAALKNIQQLTEGLYDEAYSLDMSATTAYQHVLDTIDEVRENYKKLVEKLNEKSKV